MFHNQTLLVLKDVFLLFPAFIFVFTFKGFFNALMITLVGDRTAKEQGFLTFNPLVHVNVVGIVTLMCLYLFVYNLFPTGYSRYYLFTLIILFGLHWSHDVEYDENNFKWPTFGGVLVSFSSSFGCFLLGFVFTVLLTRIRYLSFPKNVLISIAELLNGVVDLALWFGVLDLIPIPPFDAGKIWRFILSYNNLYIIDWLEEYSFYIVMVLFLFPGISDIFFMMISFLTTLLKLMFSLV
jgi:Zn-dependent protease